MVAVDRNGTSLAPEQDPATGPLSSFVAALPEALPAAVCLVAVVLVLLLDLHSLTDALAFPLAAVAALAGVAGAVLLRARTRQVEIACRFPLGWDVLALGAALVSALINVKYSSQHVLAARDPGVYTTTAQYLVHHSGLPVVFNLHDFAPGVVLPANGYGFTPGSTTQLYAQGMHGVPVLLALVGRILGPAALLRTDPVIGAISLLAVYSFGRVLVPRGWAFMAMVALGVCLPQIHFTRDVYSEPLGQLAVFAGLTLFVRAERLGARWALALAGLGFGASMLSRTDAFLGVIAVVAMAVVLTVAAEVGQRRAALARAGVLLVAAGGPLVIGLRDLQVASSGYYRDLHGQLKQVLEADVLSAVAAVVLVAIAWYARPLRAQFLAHRRLLGWLGGAGVALIFAGLAARPALGKDRQYAPAVEQLVHGIQSQSGLTVDPTRSYTEQSLNWMSYYLGPLTTFLGLLGVAVLTGRALRRRDPAAFPFLAAFLPVAIGYLVRPSITPDQIWASRRFLSVVMPGLVLGVAVVLARLASERRRARLPAAARLLAFPVAGAVGIATVAVPLDISHPLIRVREFVPDLAFAQAFCRLVGSDATVLGLDQPGESLPTAFQPTVTSYCRVPTAQLAAPTRVSLARDAAVAAAEGRTLWVYAALPASFLHLSAAPAGAPTLEVQTRVWRFALTRAPFRADANALSIYVGRVAPDGSVSLVAGKGGLAAAGR